MQKNYFTKKEMQCHCCGANNMSDDFMLRLNQARKLAGIPFFITSGYRCKKHNEEVGSTSTNHTRGKAADIMCNVSKDRYLIVEALLNANMLGIGIGQTFIHCDINRDSPAVWLY